MCFGSEEVNSLDLTQSILPGPQSNHPRKKIKGGREKKTATESVEEADI